MRSLIRFFGMKILRPTLLVAFAAAIVGLAAIAASPMVRPGPVSEATDTMVTPPTPRPTQQPSKGEEIYLLTCRMCHETGTQGAPRLGNQEEWKERLPKGRKTLLKHSLEGFGAMPAKGGHVTLTKKEVSLALNFMLAKLR